MQASKDLLKDIRRVCPDVTMRSLSERASSIAQRITDTDVELGRESALEAMLNDMLKPLLLANSEGFLHAGPYVPGPPLLSHPAHQLVVSRWVIASC
jgi:hypothetical protein